MPHTGQFHIGKQLRIVDAGQLFHTFEFEDNLILHQNIDAVSAFKLKALVLNWKRMLQQECNAL